MTRHPITPTVDRPPVVLHLMHGWGGGLAHWVRNYIEADRGVEHLVLKPIGNWGSFGEGLLLHRSVDSNEPLRYWKLDHPIKATAVRHPQYDRIFRELLAEYRVDQVMVSSLIGHSLDALRHDVPTCLVLHEYYPFCPALNISFEGQVCPSCDKHRLSACFQRNEHNRFFLVVHLEHFGTDVGAHAVANALVTIDLDLHLSLLQTVIRELRYRAGSTLMKQSLI